MGWTTCARVSKISTTSIESCSTVGFRSTRSYRRPGKDCTEMSGFVGHIRCPSCGLASPTFDLTPSLSEPSRCRLPTAETSPPRFGTIFIEIANDSLATIAQQLSTGARQLTIPRMHLDGRALLDPPLCCPACGHEVSEAIEGEPRPKVEVLDSLEHVVAQTRDPEESRTRRFDVSAARIVCAPLEHDGRVGKQWRLVRRDAEADILRLAHSLIDQLAHRGSQCEEPSGVEARVSFIEWVDAED